MMYKCCAPGCRGNYKNTPKVHTFGFPKDENLRASWLNFIKREKTFKVTEHTRLCENHFRPEDIVKRNKVFDHQKKVFVEYELKNPYLKEKTMPHFLLGCPKHLSKPECSRKSREDKLKNKEDDELEHCIAESLQTHQQYETEKSFSNLGELSEGLKKYGDWNNWTIVYYENEIVFVIFSCALIMKVICSIVVNDNCDAKVFNDMIKLSKFRTKLNNFNQLEKILKEVSAICNSDKCSVTDNVESRVKNCISLIEYTLHEIGNLVSDEEKKAINYLIEQVKFLYVKPYRYRYSTELIILACIFYSISPHAYTFVHSSRLVVLPHPETIYKVCAKYDHLNPFNVLIQFIIQWEMEEEKVQLLYLLFIRIAGR